ncbi:hypothetical protein JXK06_03115 [Patescibacteria group bacterium]|nr:hypothetical protein [Patescibacteria group bacterium]
MGGEIMRKGYYFSIILGLASIVILLILFISLTKENKVKKELLEALTNQAKQEEIQMKLRLTIDSLEFRLDSLNSVSNFQNAKSYLAEKNTTQNELLLKKELAKKDFLIEKLKNENNHLSQQLKQKDGVIEELELLLKKKDIIDPDDFSIISGGSDKIIINPAGFFNDYIEIISENWDISKAVLKDRSGNIVKEFVDPIIINTNSIKPGVYYLSFYDREGRLIQAAQAVCKMNH